MYRYIEKVSMFKSNTQIGAQRLLSVALVAILATTALAACGGSATNATATTTTTQAGGIQQIKHVVVIMQENRSFDSYFGTYPGADGIPMQNGVPTVCVPDPRTNQCVKPFHDPNDRNCGGPHGEVNAITDINGGKMDGFQAQADKAIRGCANPNNP